MDNAAILRHHKLEKYAGTLQNYTHVGDVEDLLEGDYLRWIRGKQLTNGAFLVRVEISKEGILLTLKKEYRGRVQFFSVWADEVVFFRKLSLGDLIRQAYS